MQPCRSYLVWGFLNSLYGLRSAGRGVAIGVSSTASDESATVPSNGELASPFMGEAGGAVIRHRGKRSMSGAGPKKSHWLDYFVAYVPAGAVFSVRVDQLRALAAKHAPGPIFEICLVALVAYFEAFCKDQFAAVINLCPKTLDKFTKKKKRKGLAVELSELLPFVGEVDSRLGFLLSDRRDFDFGRPDGINNLYHDLLGITPFSKDQAQKYDRLLDERNLLVHHGGVFTVKHVKRYFPEHDVASVANADSVEVTPESLQDSIGFLEGIAKKVVLRSHHALEKFVLENEIELDSERKEALGYLALFD